MWGPQVFEEATEHGTEAGSMVSLTTQMQDVQVALASATVALMHA